jgi:hypothetical protein
MRLRPDHRARAVMAALEEGTPPTGDVLSAELFALLSDAGAVSVNVQYAHDLYADEEHRAIVDAFLLTRTPFSEIGRLLSIDVPVLEVYAHLYMDISVFRNRLEIISFAARYVGSPYGQELVKTAVTVGVDYLRWAYGGGSEQLDPREIIKRTMVDSYFRGMAHKGNALTTNVAKEAHKWWQTAVKNAELSERLNPSTGRLAIEELRIALTQNDETTTVEQFDVPASDILH